MILRKIPKKSSSDKKWLLVLFPLLTLTLIFLTVTCRTYEIKGGPLPQGELTDGMYTGRSAYGPVRVKAEVTINNGYVTDIKLQRHFQGRGSKAEEPVIERIISEQSTDVDAVTGATGSSIAIMNAVEEAVQQARK